MQLKTILIQEFDFRVFNESYSRIYRCLSMIDDDLLWNQAQKNTPSIGNLILHLTGNARQWILSGLGDKPDNRNRDQEFVPQQKIKKSELIFLLENMKFGLKNTISELSDADLLKKYQIQGFEVSGFSVLIHVIEHFSYHTGQIVTLTKIFTGKDTNFYDSNDLNKRNKEL